MRRTALITGASRGFGLALARHLAADGWNLVVDGRDADALERARRAIRDAGRQGDVIAMAGDIGDPVHVAALVNAAAGQGGFELLVNNASTLGPSPLPHVAWLRTGDLERILATNVVAPLRIVQAALPHLRETRGAIVNVTSDAAVESYEGWGGYGASKAALEQLSRVLAAEEPGVRVWWVDPGDMRTQMHQDAFPGEDISDRPTPESRVPGLVRLIRERPPSGRHRVEDWLEAPDPVEVYS
ncbi:MAG TPA: SDR family oxidoreductase [Acidimicrobiales bacterium]|nr:SDR family oxidoreductase [Acidimicrobiales bacterium]